MFVPQSQLGSVPLKNPEMTAAAQPTPCFTFRALRTAIDFTGTTFHAAVPINNLRLFILHPENIVRAYFNAHPAPDAKGGIIIQGGYIFKVGLAIHVESSFEMSKED